MQITTTLVAAVLLTLLPTGNGENKDKGLPVYKDFNAFGEPSLRPKRGTRLAS